MVDRLFKYLYALEYDVHDPEDPDGQTSELFVHARVYMIADKYDVPDLKQHAASLFKQSVGT